MQDIRQTLTHALTRYDRAQEGKPGYNRYALGIYLGRVDDIAKHMASGMTLHSAIHEELNDRLADFVYRFTTKEMGVN